MKLLIKTKPSNTVMVVIVSCGLVLATCMDQDRENEETSLQEETSSSHIFTDYAGSQSCAGCHKDIFESHNLTAHHLTSMPANENNVQGDFSTGRNKYSYGPALYMIMEKTDSGLFQSVYYQGEKKKYFRFDITTGSGAKGQTYLYWVDNKLFQMPVSYFTASAQWSVSPGFPPDKVIFDKPITSRCLECHATFAQGLNVSNTSQEEFDHDKIIYGVDCERCHGPGAAHVSFHQENQGRTTGSHIIDPSRFSRQQKLDMCVLCHGGSLKKTQPSFTFDAGEKLSDHFMVDTLTADAIRSGNVDVHGNQFGMLRASRCFRMGSNMTCMTCHSQHTNERGNTTLFSSRCMECHTESKRNFCTINPRPAGMEKNCIDCHMPKKPSMAVTMYTAGAEVPTPAMIRTHFINIYPEETRKFKPLQP
jgi:hypothetical protein